MRPLGETPSARGAAGRVLIFRGQWNVSDHLRPLPLAHNQQTQW